MIMAIDLGVHMGIATGPIGGSPVSHSRSLKTPDQSPAVAFARLLGLLDETFRVAPPSLLVKEAPMHLGAFAKRGNAAATVRFTHSLHGIVEAMCERYRVKWQEVAPATVRKHFIGKANAGDRKATKAAVVARCHLLKYLPKDCHDDDRADACAIFDWATAQTRVPGALHLFGETPAPFVSIGDAAASVVRKVRRRRVA